MNNLKLEHLPIDRLIPYANNSRTHSDEQVAQIAASIREFGFTNPVLIDNDDGIIAGHGRVLAARKLSLEQVPCIRLGHLTEAQRRAYIIADNKLALNAGWDEELLKIELTALRDELDFDPALTGFSESELDALLVGAAESGNDEEKKDDGDGSKAGNLSERFLCPPFTVLNAREGWWQDRKRRWIEQGIKSELGRGENGFHAAPGGSPMVSGYDKDGNRLTGLKNIGKAKTFSTTDWMREKGLSGGCSDGDEALSTGTSIFDPVLTELAYRWFSPSGGTIIDPFAGGSVRGIVASKLGRRYVGHELRPEQVAANREQATQLCGLDPLPPVWVEGDSRNMDKTCHDVEADMLLTCPPYADLEVYSDDPADLSTLDYPQFKDAYFEIIAKACKLLKQDSFAVCVVGEVRDKKGNYYDFVGDTVQAFRDAGLHFYNEAILVTAVGSLPIRAGKQFSTSRKLGKTHQNVLVFVKGDGKRAAQRCGEVEVDVPDTENADLAEQL